MTLKQLLRALLTAQNDTEIASFVMSALSHGPTIESFEEAFSFASSVGLEESYYDPPGFRHEFDAGYSPDDFGPDPNLTDGTPLAPVYTNLTWLYWPKEGVDRVEVEWGSFTLHIQRERTTT